MDIIERAYNFAFSAHKGQFRKYTGDPYINHPVAVIEGTDILKDVYGYTPEIKKEVEYEREILKQAVEDLDLASVIKAINKL